MWNEPMPVWRTRRRDMNAIVMVAPITIQRGDHYLDQAVIRPTKGHRRYCQECAEPVLEKANGYHYFRGRNGWPDCYQQHIASAKWKRLKLELIEERGNNCEQCGQGGPLHLHHRTYERLGDELPKDVELLCYACHMRGDQERALRKKDRRCHPRSKEPQLIPDLIECKRCGRIGGLRLLYRTFESLRDEPPEDVELLCHFCQMEAE